MSGLLHYELLCVKACYMTGFRSGKQCSRLLVVVFPTGATLNESANPFFARQQCILLGFIVLHHSIKVGGREYERKRTVARLDPFFRQGNIPLTSRSIGIYLLEHPTF